MNEISVINGIKCFEKEGVAYLNLEAVARGLGFTKTDVKISETGFRKEYVRVDWIRVDKYLKDFGYNVKQNRLNEFIPENIFYRLAMKANNAVAEKFQALVADEIIPAIRKTGSYGVNSNAITIDPNVLAMIVGECMKQMIPYIQRPIEVQTETNVRAIKAPVETVIKRKSKWPTHEPRKNGIGARYPDYGQRLTKQMMKRNVDDLWLASQINVSKQTVYTWRTGVNFPTYANYMKVNVVLKWRGY